MVPNNAMMKMSLAGVAALKILWVEPKIWEPYTHPK
jgi:hypothetical protein